MQIGRRIYYELETGNPILDTGERSGDVIETTIDQDFETFKVLADRVRETVGCLQLEYGQYAQDFAACSGYRVDVSSEPHRLVFSYPDPSDPGELPVYQKPLTEQVAVLQDENAFLALELATTQARLDQTEREYADLLLTLVAQGVI